MPERLPEGIKRDHILLAIQELDNGVAHAFADSTEYDVLFEGRRYPPKAVVGLAAEQLTGEKYGPYDFKGGEHSASFRTLEQNGFDVVRKGGAQTRQSSKSLPITIDQILKALRFTDISLPASQVLIARHASEAHTFFHRSTASFEEYQRFQINDYFGKCRFIVSFLGLPRKGGDATFAGIYDVLGRVKRGDPGFRDPEGDLDVVRTCAGQSYLYALRRLSQYDFLWTQWDVRWNLPGTAKYRYYRPGLQIPTLRFGDSVDASGMKSLLDQELFSEGSENTADPDEWEFPEGAAAYTRHIRRERNAALVSYVKSQAMVKGHHFCFVCGFDSNKVYGIDYIECHHTIPVSEMGSGHVTKPEDCVLLCANCHRATHKHRKWLKKADLHLIMAKSSEHRFGPLVGDPEGI